MTHSSPWKITIFKDGKPLLFLWAIYTMAMLNNQRVYTIIYPSWKAAPKYPC